MAYLQTTQNVKKFKESKKIVTIIKE